ncbi:MAG: glycosyltransferase [Gammaproteobacteria bacterium]|nr:glycosyltransferase [Gammaproteobacteria bacterium]
MTVEEQTLSLVLHQQDNTEQSVIIYPLVERQRLCFDNLAADQTALTLSIRRSEGVWRDGFIHLYRIVLKKRKGETDEVLLQYKEPDEILQACQFNDLRYRHSALGEVFVVTGPNPSLQISLAETKLASRKTEQSLQLCVEMSAPYSLDYAIALDGFIQQENNYITRIRELESELQAHKQYKVEIEDIKRSKAWHMIECVRELIYDRLLGRLPSLRNRALTVTRPGDSATSIENKAGDGNHYTYTFVEAESEWVKKEISKFDKKPLISLVMPVFNVSPKWLKLAIKSVECQLYENWELCIVDDASSSEETVNYLKTIRHPRIRIRYLDNNRNISGATNEAIRFAKGEYLAFMDNDDELTPDAVFEMVSAVNEFDADMIYSDEDFIDLDGNYCDPHYKPDFSPDLLLSHNYITHFVVVKKQLAEEVGLLDSRYDGAQDHEFLLRVTEKSLRIHHVQKVLYHWRRSETSTSFSPDAKPGALISARMALQSTLERRKIDADLVDEKEPFFFRVKRRIKGSPLVSIVIPFRDKPDLLNTCINSILDYSTWDNYEIVAVSNNSRSSETFGLIHQLEEKSPRFHCVEFNEEFNFSRVVNYGVSQSKGEHLIILNNDIEIISWDWIEAMLEQSQREEVGAVGAKLLYPNNTIQHAGIIIGLGGYAGHSHKHTRANSPGYFNLLQSIHNVSAVTGACMMISHNKFDAINGFDEENFKIAYNDVDFCLRLREQGLLNIFTPYAELYHHESISRGYEDTDEKQQRFSGEKKRLRERHAKIFEQGDPYYNPNLTHDREDYSIR